MKFSGRRPITGSATLVLIKNTLVRKRYWENCIGVCADGATSMIDIGLV